MRTHRTNPTQSIANPGSPSKYSWVLDVLEQVTICKYKGKPHWCVAWRAWFVMVMSADNGLHTPQLTRPVSTLPCLDEHPPPKASLAPAGSNPTPACALACLVVLRFSLNKRGKNHERSFKHPACPIRDHLPLFGRMEAFAASSDPQHIFQPRLFEEIASRTANTYSPGCSVRGECYCLTDSHCAKGWSCLPSRAFPEYKACRLQHGLLPVIP